MLKGKIKINTEAIERLFKPRTPAVIGADLSSSAVKLIEIADAGGGAYRVEHYAVEPLPPDAVVDGNINSLEAVSDALRRCYRRTGSKIKNLAMALPGNAVISKTILVPAGQTEDELELQVETEANQYIPFVLDEVNLDFQVLGPAPNSAEDVEVLIAASRKEKVVDRVAVAEAAGLKALVMDVDTFAAQAGFDLIKSTFPENGKDQNIAMVDIGASVMQINVLRNGQSVYMREQPFGGNQLTQEIVNKFGLTPEEAETAKRLGGLPENYESEVLHPFLDMLSLEVARLLQFFYTSTQYNQVDHVVLCGGCAALPGVAEVVGKRVDAHAIVANPFCNMALSSHVKPKNLAQDAPSLMVACGLAMRRFDP
jgi:type IV pilus assembly protein PilM